MLKNEIRKLTSHFKSFRCDINHSSIDVSKESNPLLVSARVHRVQQPLKASHSIHSLHFNLSKGIVRVSRIACHLDTIIEPKLTSSMSATPLGMLTEGASIRITQVIRLVPVGGEDCGSNDGNWFRDQIFTIRNLHLDGFQHVVHLWRSEERENDTDSMKKGIHLPPNNLNFMSFKSVIHLCRNGMATILDHNLVKY